MKYLKLKPNVPPFDVVSGEFAGRTFRRGVTYAEADIPAEHKDQFEELSRPARPARAIPSESLAAGLTASADLAAAAPEPEAPADTRPGRRKKE
jgi:hypothetical protein